jgi:hypothetical protein
MGQKQSLVDPRLRSRRGGLHVGVVVVWPHYVGEIRGAIAFRWEE